MNRQNPQIYRLDDHGAHRDHGVCGDALKEHALSPPPQVGEAGLIHHLVGPGVPAPRLFASFVALNPSFQGNTASTYLTQISRYLADWFFDFGDLPARYAPIAAATQIATRYFDAEGALPPNKAQPLAITHSLKRLERECQKLWQEAQRGIPPRSDRKQRMLSDTVPCGRRRSREIALPPLEINKGEQRLLAWILHRYDSIMDGEFWRHVLSDQSIGEAIRCYRHPRLRQERGGQPLSSASICLRMTALAHFRTSVARDLDINFPETLLRKPHVGERYRVVIEPEELDRVASHLRKARNDTPSYLTSRDELLFELLYSTGMRVSAIASLTPSDISTSRGVVRIREKGDKVRELPLLPSTTRKIKDFLQERERHLSRLNKAHDAHAPLFHSRRGKSLTRAWIFAIVETIGKKSGLEAGLGPHTIRRSMACALYDNGAPLHAIQQLLGHRSPLTTARYLAHGTRTADQALRSYHPWARSSSVKESAKTRAPVRKTSFSPRGRADSDASMLKVRAASPVVRPDPGYLRMMVQESLGESSILTTFAHAEVGLRAATRKNYETDCKHFISDRLHDLELPVECAPVHRAVLSHFLADRLDWLVRTGEVSEEDGRVLFEAINGVAESPLPLLPHFRERTKTFSKLVAGIEESVTDRTLRLRIPAIMRQDSDKNRGRRVDYITRGVFHRGRSGMTNAFWQEVFNREKAAELFDAALLRGAQTTSLQRCMSSLQAFGRIVFRTHTISSEKGDSVVQLSPIRSSGVPRPQKILTIEEIQGMFRYLDDQCQTKKGRERGQALHDRAVFAILYTTAARIGSLTSLSWKEIDERRSTVYLREKGGREVILPLLPLAKRALTEYRKVIVKEGQLVFGVPRGGPLDRKHVERMLTRVASKVGIKLSMRGSSAIGPHTVRRSVAVHMTNNGASLFDLQRLLGHRRLEDTSRYVMHGTVHLRELMAEYLPKL